MSETTSQQTNDVDASAAAACSDVREVFLDPDFRKTPKTTIYCAKCQRDLKTGNRHVIRISKDGMRVIHHDDATNENSDVALVGSDCLRSIPIEFR